VPGNGRLDPGELAGLVATVRNFGPTATNAVAYLATSDPLIHIDDDTGVLGDIAEGETVDNLIDEFMVRAEETTPQGHLADMTLTVQYDGGETVSNFQLLVGRYEYLVWDPTPDQSSGPKMHATLATLGYSGNMHTALSTLDLDDYATLWISLGIYADNYVIASGSQEALLITNFINDGGSVYMEGGDTWYYDPSVGGHNFNALFGVSPFADGSGDLTSVVGQPGTLAAGMTFAYGGENSYIDRLNPSGGGFTVMRNASPTYGCMIGKEYVMARTLAASFEFGGLTDGAHPSTKAALAAAIMDFLNPDASAAPEALAGELTRLALTPAAPNPFQSAATFRYALPREAPVEIGLYDVSGRCVRALAGGVQEAGEHVVTLERRALEAGVYFIRAQSGETTLARKCVIAR